MARSPYLEAKVNRWCLEKRELVIEDCDPVTFNIIVDYMYGIAIPDSVPINTTTANTVEDSAPPTMNQKVDLKQLAKLLKMSDRLLMADLKYEVEGFLVKVIDRVDRPDFDRQVFEELWEHIVDPADKLSCDKLLAACAKSMALVMRSCADQVDQDERCRDCTEMVERVPSKFVGALLSALIQPDQNAYVTPN